jgi:hypothetical protein
MKSNLPNGFDFSFLDKNFKDSIGSFSNSYANIFSNEFNSFKNSS